ncbi:putative nucleic acid-binding protein [Pyrodictium delaneyi]|uniref:Putative nucleic acid-binding protein n=1 Tax=Pyrodictium delaneyi TaxID=1273541 RepID=A0A0P0N6Q4_9CREN|nr:type II toxin-antitoxin system VapC family toxin [Pyrodictium delaneyi]ALL01998.1 putative nucleic acid-binding protein [Pyrodictium delaneyi]OWJ54836.1 hypothetical protein Pdsh_03740 [Pyrodictium delaneyi]
MEEGKIYDTSAVIELVARRGAPLVPGYISVLTAVEYPPAVPRVLGILYPTKQDYRLAIAWQARLRKLGTPMPAVDLVIAAQAYNNGMELVALDKHFKLLKEKIAPDIKLTDKL